MINEDYPKVKNVDARELSSVINYILSILNVQKPNDEVEIAKMDEQMLLVGDLIRTEFGKLTVPEIKTAFKMYVSKQFPSVKVFRLVDCIAVAEVLTAFIDHRNEALRIYDQKKRSLLEKQALPEITEAAKLEIVNNGIIRVFNEYKESGVMPEPNAWVFEELYQRKIIRDASNEKQKLYYQKMYNQACKEVEVRLKTEKATGLIDGHQVKTELLKITENRSSKVDVRCKTLILTDYFKYLIAEGKNIETIVN